MNTGVSADLALIGFGQVRHTRLRPVHHAFSYPTWFLLLPMRALQQCEQQGLAVNRGAAIAFHDHDHGDGRGPKDGGACAWMDELLQAHDIHDATGPLWLHTYPRVLGYTFKPVSFWYAHRADGSLRAIVAEVNNTFGERHCYLLDAPRPGQELQADKCFHVSPFCSLEGHYRFRFLHAEREGHPRTVVRVDYDDASGPLLQTSVSGVLEPVSPLTLRRALWRYPAMTAMVMARIHWQALQLWLKRVGWYHKPPAPSRFVTR